MAIEPDPPGQSDDSEGRQVDGASIEFPQANIAAIRSIATVFKPTFGPLSKDLLLVETLATREETERGVPPTDDYTVTSDGSQILSHLPIEHPVGDIVRRSVGPHRPGETNVEGMDVFDGITTKLVFSGALLSEAEDLLARNVHPQEITRGYQDALDITHDVLRSRALIPSKSNTVSVTDAARSILTGNDVGGMGDKLASIAADAAAVAGFPNEKSLRVTTIQDGALSESRLVAGSVLDRNTIVHDAMPRQTTDADLLLLGGHENGGLQNPGTGDAYNVTEGSPDSVGAFNHWIANNRKEFVDRIAEAGVDVVVTQQGINNHYQQLLAEHEIMAIRGVHSRNLTHLALATGATVVTDGNDVGRENLGTAGIVREEQIEQRRHRRKSKRMVVFDNCPNPDAATILLRGVFGQVTSQAARTVQKAVQAATLAEMQKEYGGVVPGGGAIEIEIAREVRAAARKNNSRTQLAMNAFASALESLVGTLVHNAGLDPIKMVADLRSSHCDNKCDGIILPTGEIKDATEAGVVDPVRTKKDAYDGATDLATLILRIDDALDATFEKETPSDGDVIYE